MTEHDMQLLNRNVDTLQRVLGYSVAAQALVAEIEAMKALNQSRLEQGLSQAYREEEFHSRAERLSNISKDILNA